MNPNSLQQIADQLRQVFPQLGELEIAQLALDQTRKISAPHSDCAQTTLISVLTVGQIVGTVRDRYLRKEKRRIRANLELDGSILIKNTTTYRTYETHWRRLERIHGDKPVSDLDQEMIEAFAEMAQDTALETHKKSNATRIAKNLTPREFTGGRSHNLALDAVSVIMSYAVSKKYIPDNPVKGIQRTAKAASKRRGLTHNQVEEVMNTALNGGNDPILDYILLWTLLETAARIGGLLKLQLGDIQMEEGRCVLDLHEKRDTQRLQPITRELHDALVELATTRGSSKSTDPVFRYHPDSQGRANPMQAKRFETLWRRISSQLPWVEEKGVSSHWLRHTTVTWIDRAFNPTMAQAYAGHSPANVTAGYSAPTPEELAAAHAALTGTSNPDQ